MFIAARMDFVLKSIEGVLKAQSEAHVGEDKTGFHLQKMQQIQKMKASIVENTI